MAIRARGNIGNHNDHNINIHIPFANNPIRGLDYSSRGATDIHIQNSLMYAFLIHLITHHSRF